VIPFTVRKAYKQKALLTHPDRLPQGATPEQKAISEERFRKVSLHCLVRCETHLYNVLLQVNNAYEVLIDSKKREVFSAFYSDYLQFFTLAKRGMMFMAFGPHRRNLLRHTGRPTRSMDLTTAEGPLAAKPSRTPSSIALPSVASISQIRLPFSIKSLKVLHLQGHLAVTIHSLVNLPILSIECTLT